MPNSIPFVSFTSEELFKHVVRNSRSGLLCTIFQSRVNIERENPPLDRAPPTTHFLHGSRIIYTTRTVRKSSDRILNKLVYERFEPRTGAVPQWPIHVDRAMEFPLLYTLVFIALCPCWGINMFLPWQRRAGETCRKTRGALQEARR